MFIIGHHWVAVNICLHCSCTLPNAHGTQISMLQPIIHYNSVQIIKRKMFWFWIHFEFPTIWIKYHSNSNHLEYESRQKQQQKKSDYLVKFFYSQNESHYVLQCVLILQASIQNALLVFSYISRLHSVPKSASNSKLDSVDAFEWIKPNMIMSMENRSWKKLDLYSEWLK